MYLVGFTIRIYHDTRPPERHTIYHDTRPPERHTIYHDTRPPERQTREINCNIKFYLKKKRNRTYKNQISFSQK